MCSSEVMGRIMYNMVFLSCNQMSLLFHHLKAEISLCKQPFFPFFSSISVSNYEHENQVLLSVCKEKVKSKDLRN